MTVDELLIDQAIESFDDAKIPEPRRRKLSTELNELIKHYRNACDLSRMKNEERSEHWTNMGKMFERRIRSFLVDAGIAAGPVGTVGLNRCAGKF